MPPKPFWKSKSFWFAIVTAAAGLGAEPLGVALPPKLALPIAAAGQLLLRFMTTEPITVRPAGDS